MARGKDTMTDSKGAIALINGMLERAAQQKLAELAETSTDSAAVTGKNLELRKRAWVEAVQENSPLIRELAGEMTLYVTLIPEISEEPHILDKQEANDLMVEYCANKKISEFLKSRQETIRSLVFESVALEKGDDNAKGEIVVESQGKRFAKEGGGSKKPTLNTALLEKLMGDDWEKVTDVVETRSLSEEKLLDYLNDNPGAMKHLREATVPGAPNSMRFAVRDVK